MAAFAPLNQIVWRDYPSITGGLGRNVPENKLATTTKTGPCGGRERERERGDNNTHRQPRQTRLSLKRESKGAAQILMPSRKMQGNKTKQNGNTFSVSHSKHIHQPAAFPRLIYKKKKIKKNISCNIDKAQAFPFSF